MTRSGADPVSVVLPAEPREFVNPRITGNSDKNQSLLQNEGGTSSASSQRTKGKPNAIMASVDQWLTKNNSDGSGVVVLRGEAKNQEKRKSVWETIFGGRNDEHQEEENDGPRRSKPQSVIAPDEVELVPSPSKAISVVSSMTYGTGFERTPTPAFDRTPAPSHIVTDTVAPSKIRHKYRAPITKRRPAGPIPKASLVASSYMLPVAVPSGHSNMPARSVRPKLKTRRTDDDESSCYSMNSYSTTDSLGQKVIAPPVFRQKKPAGATELSTAQRGAEMLADAAKTAESFNLLRFIGRGNTNHAETSRGGRNDSTKQSTAASLAENLVDAEEGNDIPSKVPSSDGIISTLRQMTCTSSFIYAIMFFGMASALLYGVLSDSRLSYSLSDVDISIDWDTELNVAFVGNSYLFINDIPRVMEAMSEYHIYQESVIHSTGGSLGNLLLTGNGMYPRWKTDEAVLDTYTNGYGKNVTIYDYGLCTVAQILQGYDEILSYGNEDGAYYNDGKNPCIRNQNYFNYIDSKLQNSTFQWDYVVLVDQTKRMAVQQARQQSIYALTNAYGPLIEATGAIPVLVDTHAFWSESTNMTGLVDIPTFQSLIYDGLLDYAEALASVLPDWQAPVIAPVGLAFLVVYEENYNLWQKLFIDDDIHSSVHGSYLFSCVLYATMYGHLPRRTTNTQIEALFANSRLLVGGQNIDYPSAQEAFYYRRVAKRVALDGYTPTSMYRR